MLVLLCPARRQPATARFQPSLPTRAFFRLNRPFKLGANALFEHALFLGHLAVI